MDERQYWLTLLFDEPDPVWPSVEGHEVLIETASTLQECDHPWSFRTSPIFPLRKDCIIPDLGSCFIYFYCFQPSFPVLGRLRDVGSEPLTRRLWFNIGLASVLLISEDPELHKELLRIAPRLPRATETWEVERQRVARVTPEMSPAKTYDPQTLAVPAYRDLPPDQRTVVDEFVATLAVVTPKVALHIPSEFETFPKLCRQMAELISELVYVSNPKGAPPPTLNEYTEEMIGTDPLLRERISNQAVDRLIQVNSALSYVSTQMLSGAVPITERRSLIRRHSLLGVGTAILAITRLARSVELAFSEFPIEEIIGIRMADAKPLPGLDQLPAYDPSTWAEYSLDRWEGKVKAREWYPKLPYYSGRLGFRETEYTISAALQSLTAGACTEWSLLTLTHELLHGHVRNIISVMFLGDPKKRPEDKFAQFYQDFASIIRKTGVACNELESLRAILLTYCCLTVTQGSLTSKGDTSNQEFDITLPAEEDLWYIFENEARNISEIFVHVLDLHYFYGSRLAAYIPLIWRSWATVPHVSGDLRQYALRSLLVISATVTGTAYERFNTSVSRLVEMLGSDAYGLKDIPLAQAVMESINTEEFRLDLVLPFSASVILVDLANSILLSKSIRAKLLADPLGRWLDAEEGFEQIYEYRLPNGFSETIVQSPSALLLGAALQRLRNPDPGTNTEAETARLLLACCSHPFNESGGEHDKTAARQ